MLQKAETPADYTVGFLVSIVGYPRTSDSTIKVRGFFFMHSNITSMHIGQQIRQELKRQGRTVTWLAKSIPCDRSNVYRIFCCESIDLSLLMRISRLLNYDFFKDLSEELNRFSK